MKVRLTESQLTAYFEEVMDTMEVCPCGEIISEALTAADKNDIKTMVKKEIKDFLDLNRSADFEKKVEKIVKDTIKNNKEAEKHILDITKNVLIQLYKTLWVKKSFWINDLKNSST